MRTEVLTDIEPYTIGPDATIHDAVVRLNQTEHLLLVAIDANAKLIGTIADGDIRRAIVAGHDLSSPVAHCIHLTPVVARSIAEANTRLITVESNREFVPVVDDKGCLCAIVAASVAEFGPKSALLFAGGFGKRLREVADDIPKPLVQVGGEPMIEHVLRHLEDHRVHRVFVAVHYMSDSIRAYLEERTNHSEIIFIEEDEPLGTAGAIRLLPSDLDEDVVLINADVLTQIDLTAMKSRHEERSNRLTVAVAPYRHKVPFGVVEHDNDGVLTGISEKPSKTWLISAGVQILKISPDLPLPQASAFDIPDLINELINKQESIGIFALHESWSDLGTPEELFRARSQFKNEQEGD